MVAGVLAAWATALLVLVPVLGECRRVPFGGCVILAPRLYFEKIRVFQAGVVA